MGSKGPPSDAPPPMLKMLRDVASIAAPTTANNFLYFATQTVTAMFVGKQLGVTCMAQFSVGITVVCVCGISLGVGMAAAVDTIVTQAYGRNPHNPEIGEALQRALLLNTIVATPLLVFFMFSEPALNLIFGAEIAVGAAVILRFSAPALLTWTVGEILQKTLQSQQQAQLPFYGTLLASVLCPVYNAFLVHRGLWYAMLAFTLTQATSCVFMVAVCIWHPAVAVRYCPWPSPNLWRWKLFAAHSKVAFSAMCAVCSEWWGFDMLQVIAAAIGTREVAAYTICNCLLYNLYAVPYGFSQAIAVLVGNSLGGSDAVLAHRYFQFTMWSLLVSVAFTASILYFFSPFFVFLYTDDPATTNMVLRISSLLVAIHVVDAAQGAVQGAFRGAGRQEQTARVVLFTLWGLGVPTAVLYSIVLQMGFPGILLGLATGLIVELPLMVWMLRKWDWGALAIEAAQQEKQQQEA